MLIKKHRRQEHEDASTYSSVSSRDTSPSASTAEPIILAPASRDYPPIVAVPASPTMGQDITDETLYPQASPIVQTTGDMEQLTCSRPTTPYPRASPIDQSTGDLEQSTSPELQISYKDTPGLTDLYLEPQHVQDHQMAKSSQNINIDQ